MAELTKKDIYAKLKESGEKPQCQSGKTELTDDQMDAVAGGVGGYAFQDDDGFLNFLSCSNSSSDNNTFSKNLENVKKCKAASTGASSCYDCTFLLWWVTDEKVK